MERHLTADDLHERALKRFDAMSQAEREELLKRAGILDDNGELAERYRPPNGNGQDRPHRATDAQ
jgi:hypothetical protein